MKIVILGAGPAGLYCGLLLKKAHPAYEITIIERNPPDVTYGWGVVFSDRTLASFQRADYKTYEQITNRFVLWDAIDVHYRDETIRCGGHVIASIARKDLLHILQRRCRELDITLRFGSEITDLAEVPACDLLIAADGVNSLARRTYAAHFKPEIVQGKARYIWLGTNKILDAFTFIFRENEHGLFQVHAYPSSGSTSTFIVECDEASWLNASLDTANEARSLAYCERLFAGDLRGAQLLSNNSKWISFPALKTHSWHYQHSVLLGDAAHTAHFSIGSGTKLAMEDAIALASAFEQHSDIETALNVYELERRPVVEIFQRAARESQTYFETLKRYLGLAPLPFTFQLLTRSGRISYDDLRLRDPRFGDMVNHRFAQHAQTQVGDEGRQAAPASPLIIAAPPMFAPLRLRGLTLSNRVALSAQLGAGPGEISRLALSGAGLLMTEELAVAEDGRISPESPGLYCTEQRDTCARFVTSVHGHMHAKFAAQLSHAGRRGATRSRAHGLDRPLYQGGWPLLSASALPYAPQGPVPREMDREDMERVCADFVGAARLACEADFDLLQLDFAHGYLLASFLSPLSNQRADEYGGALEGRMRFPLEVFDAVREVWPEDKPLAVAISASDCAPGGLEVDDAIRIARSLKDHGCDIITVQAGQTTLDSEPAYGPGFLTPFSDRIRNEADIPTLVGGYLTTSNEVNTILAAGRADLCLMSQLS